MHKPDRPAGNADASRSGEDRLQKLESQLAFLDRQYDELNQVVIEQGRTLSRQQNELSRTSETLRAAEIEHIRANNQKPPQKQKGWREIATSVGLDTRIPT